MGNTAGNQFPNSQRVEAEYSSDMPRANQLSEGPLWGSVSPVHTLCAGLWLHHKWAVDVMSGSRILKISKYPAPPTLLLNDRLQATVSSHG